MSKFPENWHVTFTDNHWANEKTTESYIKLILLPYVEQTRKKLQLDANHPALVVFDRFKAQCTQNILSLLDSNNIRYVIVPPNCTNRLQPLDVSVNKSAKEYLRRQFQQWYSDQIFKQMEDGTDGKIVDLAMSIVKPLGATWLIGLYSASYMKANPDIIINGFKNAGIYFE